MLSMKIYEKTHGSIEKYLTFLDFQRFTFTMSKAQNPPALNIPPSKHTVDVSIIDTTCYVGNIPAKAFMDPVMPGLECLSAPCYSMLIKHNNPEAKSKYDTLLWDLGVRKDWEKGPTSLVKRIKDGNFTVIAKKDVAQILKENGEDLNNVGGIIWSHYHWVSYFIVLT